MYRCIFYKYIAIHSCVSPAMQCKSLICFSQSIFFFPIVLCNITYVVPILQNYHVKAKVCQNLISIVLYATYFKLKVFR